MQAALLYSIWILLYVRHRAYGLSCAVFKFSEVVAGNVLGQ